MIKFQSLNNVCSLREDLMHQYFDTEVSPLDVLRISTKKKIPPTQNSLSYSKFSLREARKLVARDELLPHIGEGLNVDSVGDQAISIRNLNKLLSSAKPAGKDELNTQTLVNYVEELEEVYANLQKELLNAKNEEISRIGKEYLVNDYERVYRVNIFRIFSSIVGESNVVLEMRKFVNEKKNYYKSLELCRNYNVFQDKYNEVYSNLFKDKKQVGNSIPEAL